MNRSWSNNSISSPGFVYFQQDSSYHYNNDTSDFLSLRSSPKHISPKNRNNFSPTYSSSPRFKQNYNRYNIKQNHRYSEFNRSRSFNSSSDSFGSYDSFRGRNRHRRKLDNSYHSNSSRGGKRDMSAYLDPGCTKDPWEELERIDNEKKIADKEEKAVGLNEDHSDDSSNSENETESLSEEKSSSSTAEETT